jgi:beta-xylosidase
MSADGTRLLDDGTEIYRGQGAEGPKLFRRRGYYFISLPEGGVASGWQTVLRSKNIYGPYERRVVLPAGSPHQGGLVELDSGQAWFIGFKSTGHLGRVCHLLPVRWGEDDWPIFGDNGQPVQRWKKPDVGRTYPIQRPETSDEFDGPTLSPMWQWNHNPVNEAWSLTQRPGWLRLGALPADRPASARNTLTQRLWDECGVIDLKLDTGGMAAGQCAGLTFISGDQFSWVGVRQEESWKRIAWDGGLGPPVSGGDVWLRGTYQGDAARLWYSLDGTRYVDTGVAVMLGFACWKGARMGVMCYGQRGSVDVDYVRYQYGEKPEA